MWATTAARFAGWTPRTARFAGRRHTGGAIFLPPAIWRGRLYAGSADGRVYAYEAATGRLLWSFRAAPADRWMPVYGRLMSTWPVAGGVVAEEGVVYAAAGIAHYDGTYVYALDAVTGRVKWRNDTSGNLSEKVDCGVSLQGPLSLTAGELRFLGGGKYETARYDRATGRCLNEPDNTLAAQFRTAFYPYFPDYGRYMSLRYVLADGKEWVYDASYEGSQHTPLALLAPAPPGSAPTQKPEARCAANPAQRPPPGNPMVRRDAEPFSQSYRDARRTLGRRPHGRRSVAGGLPGGHRLDHRARISGGSVFLQPPSARNGCRLSRAYIVTLENGQVLAFAGP